ncbi:MAG: hypothetical protein QNJ89_00215 [Acidimicrobiia bacterium]|nr:hypothetical protein [Acidimicrobiia bacterium]
MRVARFNGEYNAIAPLYDQTPAQLARRDAESPERPQRWVAVDGGVVVASALLRERPDTRVFVSYAGEPAAAGPLSASIQAACRCDIYTSVDDGVPELRAVLLAAGFTTALTSERFEIAFAAALSRLRHTPIPPGFTVIKAHDADPDRLFHLDNAVRNRVPGTDGWQGNRAWFAIELDDPAAYLVAVDGSSDVYAGLARIWRNPSGPRFGLVGTREEYRRARIGPPLIRLVLEEAVQWGHPTFEAETAMTNRYLHHRLQRIAARSLGRREQLVRRRPAAA